MQRSEIDSIQAALGRSRAAALRLGSLSTQIKDQVLENVASSLVFRQEEILKANARDVELAMKSEKSSPAFVDRLTIDVPRLLHMAESLRAVASLGDPVGEFTEDRRLENGLRLRRVRAPLGVIFMIFESRPNVAIEAFSLAFKAGNAMILRGGKESQATSAALFSILREALSQAQAGLSDALWGITDPDRAIPDYLMRQVGKIDVIVPRGGSALMEHVAQNSLIPVIKNDRGMCHVYVAEDADLSMAKKIVINAKIQRPGVCNAMETLLVHRDAAARFLPDLWSAFEGALPPEKGVDWHGCDNTLAILGSRGRLAPATDSSWDTEYLDYKMNCKVVDSLDEALSHIARHGSGHSEAIITKNEDDARKFQAGVDAAAVYWNASTRFTDGFAFGLGGELGISTQKLHVRGPVGLRELTSLRWMIDGHGQVRS